MSDAYAIYSSAAFIVVMMLLHGYLVGSVCDRVCSKLDRIIALLEKKDEDRG